MKLDLFQRAVLYGIAAILSGGDQSLKTRRQLALAYVLDRAAHMGELVGNIKEAVDRRLEEGVQDAIRRSMGEKP